MKIRTGFVSNSSSSSFVALMSKEKYDELISKMDDPLHRAVVEELSSETTFMGKECVKYSYMSGNYSYLEYMSEADIFERAAELAEEMGVDFCAEDRKLWEASPWSHKGDLVDGNDDSVFTNEVDF